MVMNLSAVMVARCVSMLPPLISRILAMGPCSAQARLLSIPGARIDAIRHRLAALQAPQMRADQRRDIGGELPARGVRDHGDAGVAPKGMILRQRLLAENVERRGGEMAAVERGDEIAIDDMRAAAEIDQRRTFGHKREVRRAENIRGLGGERQEVHDDLAAAEESGKLV